MNTCFIDGFNCTIGRKRTSSQKICCMKLDQLDAGSAGPHGIHQVYQRRSELASVGKLLYGACIIAEPFQLVQCIV